MNRLKGFESLSDNVKMISAHELLLQKFKKIVNLVLVIVDVLHFAQASEDVIHVLVQDFGSVSYIVEQTSVQSFHIVTQIVKVRIDLHKLRSWLPLANDVLTRVECLIYKHHFRDDLFVKRRRAWNIALVLKVQLKNISNTK